jgi:dynein heavy chain 2
VEKELEEVQPLVDQAKKAVGAIKSDNINEIRSLKMPPDAIRDVLEVRVSARLALSLSLLEGCVHSHALSSSRCTSQGVLLIMGNPDTSWNNMKKFLGQRSVKDEIINFDARNITPAIRKVIQGLIKKPF